VRRHRVYETELPAVKVGLHDYLSEMCRRPIDTDENIVNAFRLFYRVINYRAGQPDYPTILDEDGHIQYSVIRNHLLVAERSDPDLMRMVPFYGREAYKPVEPIIRGVVASVGGGESSETCSSPTHQSKEDENIVTT
jgi:hypothetical protein